LTFREELGQRRLSYLIETGGLDLPQQVDEGLASLPPADSDHSATLVVTNLPPNDLRALAGPLAQQRLQVQKARRILLEELGLNHFEGRSWRGLHHHACLVMLAYSFRRLRPECLDHVTSSAI